ncbi:MAG TPA: DNA gyrase inhibitor YacG [Candidatus Binatia bacterium]|nr:DNA gyrase inhibitor YacG [Candidatus Binatia bacterium]
MPRKRAVKLRCPICKNPVKSAAREFPFCSERCRTIDLGKWASGDYVISSPVKDTEELIQDQSPEDRDRDR